MADPRKADIQRLRKEIGDLLEDFPRQQMALRNAMSSFGKDFDFEEFKVSFETETDMDAYNRAQSIERAIGRLQNYVAKLAIAGMKLSGVEVNRSSPGGEAAMAFESLKADGAIDAQLCAELRKAQKARSRIEHAYPGVNAGDVHTTARLVERASIGFIHAFRPWVTPYL